MATSDDLASRGAAQETAEGTQPEDPARDGEDPESAGELLRGNTLFVLAVALVVLLGILALLIAV